MKKKLIIGTNGSALSICQANYVKGLLDDIGLKSELKIFKTQSEKIQNPGLNKSGTTAFITKQIESALLKGEIDIAVHQYKDLPLELPKELVIAAVSNREAPSALLLIRKESVDSNQKFFLKKNAIVGVSSANQKAQLHAFRNDVQVKILSENIISNISHLSEKFFDAILVQAAEVEQLEIDLKDFHAEKINPKEFIPDPAEGAIAMQVRKNDLELIEKLKDLHDAQTEKIISIERKVFTLLNDGNLSAIGVYAEFDDDSETYKVYASKAAGSNDIPVSVFVESKNALTIAEKIVKKINALIPSAVFITKNLRDEDYFKNVLSANGFIVNGKSLIEMIPVPFKEIPKTDWIFFSSKHAVRFFFSQKPRLENQKYACIGTATAAALRKNGVRADFIGYSTDTKLTGKQFASRVGHGTVLFPMAKGSLRSIQNGFVKKEQVADLVVYETVKSEMESGFRFTDYEIILFTSPANVEVFFEKNKITSGQKIIAMGEATASTLKKYGVIHPAMTDDFYDAALVRAVFGASAKE